MPDYEKYANRIPAATLQGLRNYIEHKIPTGGFLKAVLQNDLFSAFSRADPGNRAALGDIVMFMVNEAPRNCWGDREAVNAYMQFC